MTKPFTIYIMQSAHTDIGYTHPQEQLEDMYLEYYDRVLDLCRETEASPEAHRFKWTCETFWQVRHYLLHRPEREAEFLHYVRCGQIEITALYAHFTDLIDAESYRKSVALAVDYCQQHALPLRAALHCDINGWPWAVADILAEYNIPYFISQLNLDMGTDPLGRRGSVNYEWLYNRAHDLRSDVPTRIPQAFYWQGPRGGQVLHWLNEHYLLGNVLGLSGRKGFHADKTRYLQRQITIVPMIYTHSRNRNCPAISRIYAPMAMTLMLCSSVQVASMLIIHRLMRAGITSLSVGIANTRISVCVQRRSANGLLIS